MRIVSIACVLCLAVPAHADSVYFAETFTAASYQGDLAAYGKGGLRFQFGINLRQGAWTVEVLGGVLLNEHLSSDPERGAYTFCGVDLRRSWPLKESRWQGLGARVALHAGPRLFIGNATLTGYRGPGVSAGASLEGDLWVIGYFAEVGFDAMWMQMPVDHVAGIAPFIGIGGKLGWL